MGKLSAFDHPRETLEWAREALLDLHTSHNTFFGAGNCRRVIEFNPDIGLDEVKLVFAMPIAKAVRKRATETILHIKHSFDQMAYASCAAIGKTPQRDIYYPWAQNPDPDLKRLLSARLPPEIWEPFERQEPYPRGEGYTGGNDVIRALATIANRKHTVGLKAAANVGGLYIGRAIIDRGFHFAEMRWDSMKNEIVIARGTHVRQSKADYNLQLEIVFNEAGALQGIGIIGALMEFVQKADQALSDLTARCKLLGAT